MRRQFDHVVFDTPPLGAFIDGAVLASIVDATVLVVRGTEGELAVMAGHIPFITAVKPGVCKIVLSDDAEKTAAIGGGILTVQNDKTTLLCSDFKWTE